jgi:hypothetical protein
MKTTVSHQKEEKNVARNHGECDAWGKRKIKRY